MRLPFIVLSGAALVAALTAHVSEAQVYLDPTPAPTVNAARETWQQSGEPLFYRGEYYYPTGPTEFFDGKVMSRTGTHHGVPLYEDRTRLPYEVVYVPVGGKLMKPYERRYRGDLAGTTGSRTPSFAVEPRSRVHRGRREESYGAAVSSLGRADWDWPRPIDRPEPEPLTAAPGARPGVVPAGVVRRVPTRETTNAGAFLQFDGARYVSSGRAVPPRAGQFQRVGESGGASVYREVNGNPRTIYLESVPGGPLAPYTRR